MFSSLRRGLRRAVAGQAGTAFAPTERADGGPDLTDSANDLFKGTEIVEYSGDFAATVIMEHFAEHAPAAR